MDIRAQIHLIGDLLVNSGHLTAPQLKDLEKEFDQAAGEEGQDLESILIERGVLTEEQLLKIYGESLDIPYIKLDDSLIDSGVVPLIPAKFANKNKLIAVKKENGTLTVAIRDPFAINVIDELKVFTKMEIVPVLSLSAEIEEAIRGRYGVGAETVERMVKDSRLDADGTMAAPQTLDEVAKDASMINYVNQLLREAFTQRATDIHIEPFESQLRVRYRVDGVLSEAKTPIEISELRDAIISRLKIMSNLNVAEKRRPQDGRCRFEIEGNSVDLRLSTFPTLFGEGMSIRLLNRDAAVLDLEHLGLDDQNLDRLKGFLARPHGIFLVTGPTGCGKTTTLYACINHLNDEKINIVTLEDPIEYQLDGVNQIQTNPKVELTFANGFRSILRQDPDAILVGEIRDSETAHIAIRAALTGHLIFSTLHTNSASATIARLLNLGVEPYLLASTLKGVMAQRLVRRICPHCQKKKTPDAALLTLLGIDAGEFKGTNVSKGSGCAECQQTGYLGRLAIFELLTVDEGVSRMILAGANEEDLKERAWEAGMRSLREDGLEKVKQGLTTIEELIRVTE